MGCHTVVGDNVVSLTSWCISGGLAKDLAKTSSKMWGVFKLRSEEELAGQVRQAGLFLRSEVVLVGQLLSEKKGKKNTSLILSRTTCVP